MAFKTVIANTNHHPFVTISCTKYRGFELTLSAVAYRAIGEPRAIAFEWDDDEGLLRISAASPDSPEASRFGAGLTPRCGITPLIRALDIHVERTSRFPVTTDGPLALIADLSECRSR